jgi:signal transduction histidine kinase
MSSVSDLVQLFTRLRSHIAPWGDVGLNQTLAHAQEQLEALEAELAPADEQRRLAALYQVSQALGSSLDLSEVLNQVMDAVIRLTGAERGFLMLFEESTGELQLRVARNFNREVLNPRDVEVSTTVTRAVADSGTPVITTNAQADPRFAETESVIHFSLRSIMATPLRARGKVIGVVYVDNKARTGLFEQNDVELLTAFASQSAVAIENARLYTLTDEALRRRVAELQTMQTIDRELNSGLNFERVMQIAVEWAVRGTGAASGWIGLKETESGVENVRVIAAATAEPAAGQATPNLPAAEAPAPGMARLVVPVLREGRPAALIAVERPSAAFPEDAEAFLVRLADHAAVAIENARLYQAVRQANDAKSQFVSTVSHELKIPMTSIRGYTDILRRGMAGPISESQGEMLNIIRNNVDRMAVLVSDLSDISRIETGRLRLEVGPVSASQALEETLTSLRPAVEAKGQRLSMEIAADLPPVLADRARLAQILTNLINNAHKYTPAGGAIHVTVNRDGGRARFAVADTGVGISPADQARLFTQFFRSDDPAVREQAGWGLGLNITRRLVELQGGQIEVRSELGQGSTFQFTLPLSLDSAAP